MAIIYDWENVWALNDAQGPRRGDKGCLDDCKEHYRAFWKQGIPVDIIDMEQDLSGYKLVVAPMLYMVRPGVAERIAAFVEAGGTFVATYWSGIVDENDLCFLGGFPGPLREVLGIWAEEIDALYEGDTNGVVPAGWERVGPERRVRGARAVRPDPRRIRRGAGDLCQRFLCRAAGADGEPGGRGAGVLCRLAERERVPG